MPVIPRFCTSSRHLYQIVINRRDELLNFLNEHDVFPGVHYVENTNYRMYEYAHGQCPKAEYVSKHTLSLPLHLNLNDEDIRFISSLVVEFETNRDDKLSSIFPSH